MIFKDHENLYDNIIELSSDYNVSFVCPDKDIVDCGIYLIRNFNRKLDIKLLKVDYYDYGGGYYVTICNDELWIEPARAKNGEYLFLENDIVFCTYESFEELRKVTSGGVLIPCKFNEYSPKQRFVAEMDVKND